MEQFSGLDEVNDTARTRRSLTLVGLMLLVVSVASAVAVVLLTEARPTDATLLAQGFWIATLIIVVAWPARLLTVRGSSITAFVDDLALVPVLAILPPLHAILAVAAGSLLSSLLQRRAPEKALFNVAQQLFAVSVSVWVVTTLAPTTPDAIVATALAAALGALLYGILTLLLTSAMVSFATGTHLREVLQPHLDYVIRWSPSGALGMMATLATLSTDWGFLLALLGVAAVVRSSISLNREAAARIRSDRLQRATASIRATRGDDAIIRSVTASAADLVGADEALVLERGDEVPTGAVAVRMGRHRTLAAVRSDQGPEASRRPLGWRPPARWTDIDRDTLAELAGVADDTLRAAELIRRLQSVTNSQNEAVVAYDATGTIIFANPSAVRLVRAREVGELVGRPVASALPLYGDDGELDLIELGNRPDPLPEAEAMLVRSTASQSDYTDIAMSVSPALDDDGEPSGAVLVIRDVTERRAYHEALAYRAQRDELTGLANRRMLLERIEAALDASRRTGHRVGLVLVNLDRFKLINETFGRVFGDRVLVQVADRLRQLHGTEAALARTTGDEFHLLVEGDPDAETLTVLGEKVLDELKSSLLVGGHDVTLSTSVAAAIAHPGQTTEDLVSAADAALTVLRVEGGHSFLFASDDVMAKAAARMRQEALLRRALEGGELEVHYHPIIDTRAGHLVGVEALMRWPDADADMTTADAIRLAEDTGLIVQIGRWILVEACSAARRWNSDPARPPIPVSVNLSALQLVRDSIADEVAEVLAETGLPPEQLCLEVTETAVFRDPVTARRSLDALRALGVTLAIDDFGTGYSSLAYLRELPIQIVKLDAAFITGLGRDRVDTHIAAMIIRLCKVLGRSAVAEGVETWEQHWALRQMGCGRMQGYLHARPMPEAAFLSWRERNAATPR